MKTHEKLLLSLSSLRSFSLELKRAMQEFNLSLKELSELSGIPYSTLHKIIKGRDFRVSTLIKIVNTFKKLETVEEPFIAVIAARPVLNKITPRKLTINGEEFLIKEYPANTLEECIISAIKAEKEGAKGIVCAPIVSSTIEKVVSLPVAVVIPEEKAFLTALEILAKKIKEV
ncbi:transcriptional regulator, XRE family [Methanocaldococcus infernus ME]|uniref:Transcriptional regulator, XRE family n=1 Tax=Methanocaldococcus infernus (strain DSM 11812 / JCM 15783 / ME) TaxID=573063 RepID=D5VSJ0_METIM|nr:helix-turn-helix domain-containing protein [Methanocaldococcus infernus]ADG13543.1 transcriptional regulator, XRE family [Methanocaldococcus infernus ME]